MGTRWRGVLHDTKLALLVVDAVLSSMMANKFAVGSKQEMAIEMLANLWTFSGMDLTALTNRLPALQIPD